MRRARWERRLRNIWYGKTRAYIPLIPLSWLYCAAVAVRRLAYHGGLLATTRLNRHVIVVGNISVGGTGKTPLVIALAERLQQAGLRVGILTRGYLGCALHWPQAVSADSDPRQLGDEAVLLARKTRTAVFAGAQRVAAARALLQAVPRDILISDDGLQHYALHRDLEIATVDATQGNGNGFCLPAGPLREPVSRLRRVDAVVAVGGASAEGYVMHLLPDAACRVGDPAERRELTSFQGDMLHAVAGIGNPQRFFDMLRRAGLTIQPHPFPDHHPFQAADLEFGDERPVLMTEKDALKCEAFSRPNWWLVPVDAQLDSAFYDWLFSALARIEANREGR
jgi:tetraacyldisaccharide 4'-kinase